MGKTTFTVGADSRNEQGKGASRRLRHTGKVPAILYGGNSAPANITLDQRYLLTLIDNEKFYSSIIQVAVDGQPQPAIVKDVQMHPAKRVVVHVDLQRVVEDQPIRLNLPLHFINEATSHGVKVQGGIVSHLRSDIEITCLPKDLPDALEVDLIAMNLNETLFLTDLTLPPGVTIPQLAHGRNAPVVSIHSPRVEEETAPAADAAAAAPAADAKKDGAAAKAAPAKAAPAKK